MKFQLLPLREDFLRKARREGIDDQGQPVRRYRSLEGGEPCRDVLRRARPGEEVILASYCPYEQDGPYKEYGPIYILAEPSDEPVIRDVLPLPQGDTRIYLGSHFVLRAYSHEQNILDAEYIPAGEGEALLEKYLAMPEVAYVQARFPYHGCFACRIERA